MFFERLDVLPKLLIVLDEFGVFLKELLILFFDDFHFPLDLIEFIS